MPDPNQPQTVARKAHPGLWPWLSSLWNVVVAFAYAFIYKVTVVHHERAPAEGPALVLAKHQSFSDVPLGKLAVMRNCRRHLWCVMKDSLAKPPFGWLLLRVGGIPLNREIPQRSREDLLLARRVLHSGAMLCLFPEQTFFRDAMGQGKAPGFRFVMGKPAEPVAVVPIGFRYGKRKFLRVPVEIQIGKASYFTKAEDPESFLHERMCEIAALSGLTYDFEKLPRPIRTA